MGGQVNDVLHRSRAALAAISMAAAFGACAGESSDGPDPGAPAPADAGGPAVDAAPPGVDAGPPIDATSGVADAAMPVPPDGGAAADAAGGDDAATGPSSTDAAGTFDASVVDAAADPGASADSALADARPTDAASPVDAARVDAAATDAGPGPGDASVSDAAADAGGLLCSRYEVLDAGTGTPLGACSGSQCNGSGLVADRRTGRTWARFTYFPTDGTGLTHAEAVTFCSRKGMRLPTKDEAVAIASGSYCAGAWPVGWGTKTSTFVDAGIYWTVTYLGVSSQSTMADIGSAVLCVR
jgi:hypothetical protein